MMIYANYAEAEVLMAYPDVLFIGATWGANVSEVLMTGTRMRIHANHFDQILAAMALTKIGGEQDGIYITDLYVRKGQLPEGEYEEKMKAIAEVPTRTRSCSPVAVARRIIWR